MEKGSILGHCKMQFKFSKTEANPVPFEHGKEIHALSLLGIIC